MLRASGAPTRWLISMIRLESVVGESHSSWWSGTSRRVLGLGSLCLGVIWIWVVDDALGLGFYWEDMAVIAGNREELPWALEVDRNKTVVLCVYSLW